jgi:natural product precursor
MATDNRDSGKQKSARKLKSLKLKKQTVRDLSTEQMSQVKGGQMASLAYPCSFLGPLCRTK